MELTKKQIQSLGEFIVHKLSKNYYSFYRVINIIREPNFFTIETEMIRYSSDINYFDYHKKHIITLGLEYDIKNYKSISKKKFYNMINKLKKELEYKK